MCDFLWLCLFKAPLLLVWFPSCVFDLPLTVHVWFPLTVCGCDIWWQCTSVWFSSYRACLSLPPNCVFKISPDCAVCCSFWVCVIFPVLFKLDFQAMSDFSFVCLISLDCLNSPYGVCMISPDCVYMIFPDCMIYPVFIWSLLSVFIWFPLTVWSSLAIIYPMFVWSPLTLHALECEQMWTYSLQCFWLAGRDVDVSHCAVSSTDHALGSTPFLSQPFCFDCLMSGVNVKSILAAAGRYTINCGFCQSKIHKLITLKWQDAHYQ